MSRPIILAALFLGLLVTSVPCYADSPLYEAKATIWVRSVKPSLLSEDRQLSEGEYSRFLTTQIELLKHPVVIDKALESPDVAPLPIVREQQDKRTWLTGKLVVHNGNSELVFVSIATNSAEASEKLVNAVVDAYFNFIEEVARNANNNLINNLRIEERRQRQLAQQLQERIRSATRQAAIQGAAIEPNISILAQGESLEKDTVLAETKLTAMRAQRKGIIDRMEQPIPMPVSMLINMNPELRTLNEQREVLVQQRETLVQTVSRSNDDPRIAQTDRQIEQIDERIKSIATGTDSKLEAMHNQFRLQEEVNLFQLDQEIRVQEIMVEELIQKYHEQLMKSVERAENVLDVAFEQSQLERTNKTLDRIEDRILAIATEQQAPGQITLVSRAVVSPQPAPQQPAPLVE